MTSTICINGKTITISGNGNIIVSDNKVIVDGVTVCSNEQHDVTIEGNCGSIKCNGRVTVNGNVSGNVDCGGHCDCGDVSGNVDAGGSVTAQNVNGDIDAGGSVKVQRH